MSSKILTTKEINISSIYLACHGSAEVRNDLNDNINDFVNDLKENLNELEEKGLVSVYYGGDKIYVDILSKAAQSQVDVLVNNFKDGVCSID